MGQLVRLVVGDWERRGPGLWKFHVDHTRVKYDDVLKENESYNSVIKMVRSKYKFDQLLLPTELVLLTYDFPENMTASGDYTSPPFEIKENSDVEMFMAIKIDHVGLEMYVTFGYKDVDSLVSLRLTRLLTQQVVCFGRRYCMKSRVVLSARDALYG